MRKFGLLGGLILAYGTLNALCSPSAETKDVWTSRVELEIRKHDPWVEEYIEQDNAVAQPPTVTGKAKVHRFPRRIIRTMKALGLHGFSAAYSPELDILTLPELDDENDEEVINAIDHELWHSMFDSKGRKGVLYSPTFSGPSLEEITEYAQKKTNTEPFQALRDRLRSEEELERIRGALPRFARYAGVVQRTHATSEKINDIRSDHDYDAHMSSDEKNSVGAEHQQLHERLIAFATKARDVIGRVQEWGTSIESSKEIPPLQDLVQFRNELVEDYAALQEYQAIDKEYRALQERVQTIYDTAQDKFFQARIDELRAMLHAEKDEKIRARMAEQLDDAEGLERFRRQVRQMERGMPDVAGMFAEALSDMGSVVGGLVNVTNIYQIDAVLNNPDEIMARVVDSLYSLYFGEVTQNMFPLANEDIDFLRRFRFRDELLFRKGVERYEVGMQLRNDGVPAEEIKCLEHATTFSYRGKQYHWPQAQFRFKGAITEFEGTDHK